MDASTPENTLLCVDDEQGVLNALRRLLRNEGYRCLLASGGEEALALMDEKPVQVVVSDHRMPGMLGTDFLKQVRRRYPHTVRVVLSGYADAPVILEMINVGEIYRFVPKPWDDDELKVLLRQCFERYELKQQNRRLLDKVRRQNAQLTQWNKRLERKVEARTQSLQLSQGILERLPFPVVGISRDATIVLANAAARRLLKNGRPLPIGEDMHPFLPDEVVKAVTCCLHEQRAVCLDDLEVAGRTYRLQTEVLSESDVARGCIVILT